MEDDWVLDLGKDEFFCSEDAGMVCVRRAYCAVAAEGPPPKSRTMINVSKKTTRRKAREEKAGDDAAEDVVDFFEEPELRPRSRKALAKVGLIERMPSWFGSADVENSIEVYGTRPRYPGGLVAATAVDALVPELMTRPATLNRKSRWQALTDVLETLVREGSATVLSVPDPLGRGAYVSFTLFATTESIHI